MTKFEGNLNFEPAVAKATAGTASNFGHLRQDDCRPRISFGVCNGPVIKKGALFRDGSEVLVVGEGD